MVKETGIRRSTVLSVAGSSDRWPRAGRERRLRDDLPCGGPYHQKKQRIRLQEEGALLRPGSRISTVSTYHAHKKKGLDCVGHTLSNSYTRLRCQVVRRAAINLATSAGSNFSLLPTRMAVSDPFFTHWYRVFSSQRRMAQTSLTVSSSSLSKSRS